ncbi:MAG: aspartyl protease family protein [Phycisphaerales bacterium]|nr:MAG: aspartyl protease family protein [Phycisphaerales bacterium]
MNRMNRTISPAITLALLSPATLGAPNEEAKDLIRRGDDLFRSGHFAEAEKAYRAAVADDAPDSRTVLRLGEIALLGNRFTEAERHLQRAVKLLPDDKRPKSLLAQCYYRQDKFAQAAPIYRDIGREAAADQLASFAGLTPYEVSGGANVAHVKFEQTDPLPVVKARINDSDEVYLLIDTGAPALGLAPDFAESVGARRFGPPEMITFAGGKKAPVHHGTIESIQLGEFEITSVPVNLREGPRLPMGKRIDGVIGTALLYHFVSTLDYPNGELILRRKRSKGLEELNRLAKSPRTHAVPFWMAGAHTMVAWGRVNDAEPCLLFVDTGLALMGVGGFVAHKSMIKEAGIDLSGLPSFQGIGGGGPVTVTPFKVNTLALGGAKQHDLTGVFGALPPEDEYGHGFRIGGIISHAFFRPYALTLDFDRMQLYLSPPQ